jgi:hypothetical protein
LLCLGNKNICHLVVVASVDRNNDDIDDEEENEVVTGG